MVTGKMCKSKGTKKKELIQTSEDNNEAYIHCQKGNNEAFEQQELSRHKKLLLRS